MMAYESKKRSVLIAYLLWIFLGGVGAHRYYNGRVGTGLAIMGLTVLGWLTLALVIGAAFLLAAAVWVIVDAFLIPGWVSRHNTG